MLPSSPGHYQPPSPSKTMPPPPPSTSRRPGMDHSSAAAAVMAPPVFRYPSDPGPPSSSSSTGAKRERKLTPHPDYQLPQYARQARPNPASSSGRLSYSTNTMDQVGALRRPPSRTASLKEQNKPRYAPVTSHSATQGRPPKRSMSLKGSLALSPSVQQHDAQRQYTQPQQYPLRETASLKELPNTHHHTAAAAAATLSSHPASVHSYKQAPATRSVSVRNIPTHTPSHPHPSQQHLLNSFGGYHGDLAASYPPPAKRQGQQRNVRDYNYTVYVFCVANITLHHTVVYVATIPMPVHLHGTNFAPFLLLTRRCYNAETSAILLLLKRAFASYPF